MLADVAINNTATGAANSRSFGCVYYSYFGTLVERSMALVARG